MRATYIETQVWRTNRNLLLLNGALFTAEVGLFVMMVVGGMLLANRMGQLHAQSEELAGIAGPNAPTNLAQPDRIGPVDLAYDARLKALNGRAVTLTDPHTEDIHFPVFGWTPHLTHGGPPPGPPTYHFSSSGNGHALLILPASERPGPVFTGVIRPLPDRDRGPAMGPLIARGRNEQLVPYELDCMTISAPARKNLPKVVMHPVGANPFPTGSIVSTLALFVLIALPAWNTFRALYRIKNPLTHPIYKQLGVYGPPLDVARNIEEERQRDVERVSPADITRSWLMAPSLWGLEVVHLDHAVWVFRRVMLYNFVPVLNSLAILDRQGKGHPIYCSDRQSRVLMDHISGTRPWILTGWDGGLWRRYTHDRAALIAEVDARRQAGLRRTI